MRTRKALIVPPAIESLLNSVRADSFWPKTIQNNKEVLAATALRRNLLVKLEAIFESIPPTEEITDAIDSEKIRPENAVELYNLLADFLEKDPYNRRLILYLPFEMLPKNNWLPPTDSCAVAANRFIDIYLAHWREMLKENDVRANFVDGNILEPEISSRGQKMIRKAAHLASHLVEKGYISITDIRAIISESRDPILLESLDDALSVLEDQKAPKRVSANKPALSVSEAGSWLENLEANSALAVKNIKMRSALNESRGAPKARVAWEEIDKTDTLISNYAAEIATLLTLDLLTDGEVSGFLNKTSERVPSLAVIRGIGRAVERLAKTDSEKAKQMITACENALLALWNKNVRDVRDEITVVFSRLTHLGVIDESRFDQLGISLPRIGIAYPAEIVKSEVGEFCQSIERIMADKKLSRFIYPAAIFFGSRLKGYAKSNADLDAAVFIRPGVSIKNRVKIQRSLNKVFASKKIDGKIVEFWLGKDGERLIIRDFPNPDIALADSSWVHLLFAGAWVGETAAIRELHAKLMTGFLDSRLKTVFGHVAQETWLGDMEREVLQYRLMHKGYYRVYPKEGGVSESAERLDPQSAFWDSGFRRLATKLFIARVFLPKLAS